MYWIHSKYCNLFRYFEIRSNSNYIATPGISVQIYVAITSTSHVQHCSSGGIYSMLLMQIVFHSVPGVPSCLMGYIRQIDRQVDRQIDRQIGRQIDRQVDRQIGRQIDRQIDRQVGRQVDRQIDRQVDRQVGRQIDRQIDRYIDKFSFLTGKCPIGHQAGLPG